MNDFEKFASDLSKWTGAYICAVHAYVGLKSPGGLRLLYGKIVFEPSRSEIDQAPFSFETEHIVARRSVRLVAGDDVSTAVDNAKEGRMDNDVQLVPLEPQERFDLYSTRDYPPLTSTFFIRGASRYQLERSVDPSEHLEREMKVADTPFDTFDELFIHCGLPASTQFQQGTQMELVARPPGKIGKRSTITDGKALIECQMARALDARKVKIGYRIFGTDRKVTRSSAKGELVEWRDENDLRIGSIRVPVGDAPLLVAYLSYDGVPIDQASIADPGRRLNPRHAIHQLFDAKLELLQQMLLAPEKDRSNTFEGAVSMLLMLLGFSVSNYGRHPKLQDGPDIIAITPRNHVAVVECTVGLLSQNDKIPKLVQRTQLVKEKLTAAGYGAVEVQPAIVTVLTNEEVRADLETARQHGIAVVCKETLEELLGQITLSPNPDQVLQDLKKRIPPSGQGLLSGLGLL